jgi:2'-5' RNA ligase
MAKERLKSPRLRLFLALDLPEAIRDGIVAWGRRELTDPALRPVPRESLHVTLAFLGWRAERDVERLGEIVAGLEFPAPTIELSDPAAKPSRRQARLFALPAESTGAVALQATLEEKLVSARLYKPEKRPFWPHVTVARVKPEGKGSKRPRRVERLPGGLPKDLLQPRRLVRVRLYLSELKPSGAEYVPMAQIELR